MPSAAKALVVCLLTSSTVISTPTSAGPVDDACRIVLAEAYCEPLEHVTDGCEGVLSDAICDNVHDLADDAEYELTGSSVSSGSIEAWQAGDYVFHFDDHVNEETGIQAWWTAASWSRDGDREGWFYGYRYTSTTQIAHVTDHTEVCEIDAASSYPYSDWSVGPVSAGDLVVLRHPDTGYYGAFRVDDIYGPGLESLEANLTWYLQENGSDDFGPCDSSAPLADCATQIVSTMVTEMSVDTSCTR